MIHITVSTHCKVRLGFKAISTDHPLIKPGESYQVEHDEYGIIIKSLGLDDNVRSYSFFGRFNKRNSVVKLDLKLGKFYLNEELSNEDKFVFDYD